MEAPRTPTKRSASAPGASPEGPRPRLPEPPAFRARPSGAPAACADCQATVRVKAAPPMCWGCGRPLCPDCYWRHGTSPAAHRCTSCLARPLPSSAFAISGGHATGPARPIGSP